jgi:glutamate/tyrosine decarboxylase-like PLP-dependent enzyme
MKSSMGFDLDSETRRRLGHRLIDRIDEYFASLPDRLVQLPAEQRSFAPLRNPLPDLPEDDVARVLDDVCTELVEKGFHVPSANYFGLMNPTPTYIAVLAEALVAALNPQLATMARSQLASKIEQETIRWIGERVGWSDFDGTFTSGGNEANFSALAMALAAHFPQAVEAGVASIGAQPILYASSEAHHSLDKSAGLLGIGRSALRRIAVDNRLRIDLAKLDAAIAEDAHAGRRPFCVVSTAGTTNSGAVDDLIAVAEVCRRRKLWLHVDGAYGAAAVFSDHHRDLVRGIEQADSVTLDPHKWLAMPFAAGVVVTRHTQALPGAFAVSTPYMPRTAQSGAAPPLDNFKISTQWSRRMNALKLWLTLRVHGRLAYEDHFQRQLELARNFAAWIRASEHFELFVEPDLTIVNFRVRGGSESEVAERNAALVDAVTRDGGQWISITEAGGRSVVRVMVISYLTELRHIQRLQQALQVAVNQVLAATRR